MIYLLVFPFRGFWFLSCHFFVFFILKKPLEIEIKEGEEERTKREETDEGREHWRISEECFMVYKFNFVFLCFSLGFVFLRSFLCLSVFRIAKPPSQQKTLKKKFFLNDIWLCCFVLGEVACWNPKTQIPPRQKTTKKQKTASP